MGSALGVIISRNFLPSGIGYVHPEYGPTVLSPSIAQGSRFLTQIKLVRACYYIPKKRGSFTTRPVVHVATESGLSHNCQNNVRLYIYVYLCVYGVCTCICICPTLMTVWNEPCSRNLGQVGPSWHLNWIKLVLKSCMHPGAGSNGKPNSSNGNRRRRITTTFAGES